MTKILQTAITEAAKVRKYLSISDYEPMNIFDACKKLGVDVRFDDVNMEGVYVTSGGRPYILLSKLRPMPRRVFTCAHELGHHRFGHGDKIDGLTEEGKELDQEEERLVDMFAGALLMPIAAIQSQFVKRKWLISAAGPIEFHAISSAFSTGYQTLITHCSAAGLIDPAQKVKLLKIRPSQILKQLIPSRTATAFFKIIDRLSRVTVTDIEVGNYIILPNDCIIEGNHLKKIELTSIGTAYGAVRPGIVRAASADGTFGIFVRIQKSGYEGWAEYRHLEN